MIMIYIKSEWSHVIILSTAVEQVFNTHKKNLTPLPPPFPTNNDEDYDYYPLCKETSSSYYSSYILALHSCFKSIVNWIIVINQSWFSYTKKIFYAPAFL